MLKTTTWNSALWLLFGSAVAWTAAAEETVEPVDTSYDRQPWNTVIPDYPEKARRERLEGEVQVCFDVSRQGFPRRISVRRSTHRYFEKPARKAVSQSRWRPIPPGEKVPEIKGCRTFRFKLIHVEPDEQD